MEIKIDALTSKEKYDGLGLLEPTRRTKTA
jgi:hypothetical protein